MPLRTDIDVPDYWKEIRKGAGTHVVLAVDFDSGGRSEATFSDLATQLQADVSVFETDPQRMNSDIGVTGTEYVKSFTKHASSFGRPIAAIAGFCVGSTYAEVLVREIAKLQSKTPELILFDPDTVTRDNLIRQLRQSAAGVSALFTPAEVTEINLAIEESIAEIDNLSELAGVLVARFIEISQAAFDRAGIGTHLREELTTAFTSYVAYLCGSSNFTEFPGWRNATCVLSNSLGQDHLLTIDETQFRSVSRTTNSHENLLRSTQAREAIEAALTVFENG